MKKLSLRILASLMALLLIMGLAACGGNGDGESSAAPIESSQPEASQPESSAPESDASTTADGTATTTTTTRRGINANQKAKTWDEVKKSIPASAKGKTITVYDWNPESEVPGLKNVNKKFPEETGIKLKYTIVVYNNFFTKIAAEVASKNAPDAVRVQNVSRQNLSNLQPMQSFYDFTDAAWDKNVMDAYTFNGNLYAVNMVNSPIYCPVLVYYNKNLIETYGLDDPYELWKKGKWTWDKLWKMCEDFLDEADGNDFMGLSTMAFMEYQHAYNKPTITYDKKTNKFAHNLENADYIKSWKIYASYYEKGVISQALTNNDAFESGKLLFNISMGIASRNGSSYFKELRNQGAAACVPLPALKDGAKDYQVLGEVQAFGIPKTAKNPDLVGYYLRYMLDKENYNMKSFYNVEYAAEVIEYIAKKQPKIGYNGAIMTAETTGYDAAQFINKLKTGGAADVQRTLDSYVPGIETAITEAQSFFASL